MCIRDRDWAYDKIEEEINKCKEKYGPNSLTVLTGTGREAGRYMTNTSARICVTTNQCYTQTGFSCMAPRDTVCSMIGGAGYIEYDFANGLPCLLYTSPRTKESRRQAASRAAP